MLSRDEPSRPEKGMKANARETLSHVLFYPCGSPSVSLESSARRPVLPIAVLAVDRSALRGLERNFALVPTVRAYGLVHLSGASAEAAGASPFSITQFLSLLIGERWMHGMHRHVFPWRQHWRTADK